MVIGHYQCVCVADEFETNLATVCRGLELATARGVELVSFPETFLGGYWRSGARCREHAWPLDSAPTRRLLEATGGYPPMFMVGFNELRGDALYNTVVVVEQGRLVGHYSKAFPVMGYFTPGREFPVFEKSGHRFGVIICADGGYIEPARILALKGAEVIFAPHYNYIGAAGVLDHARTVRSDHVARAVENAVWFVRGNNVERGFQPSLEDEGVGYGDSYILDPSGSIVAAAGYHAETLIWAEIDFDRRYWGRRGVQSRQSARIFGEQLRQAAAGDD